MSRLPLFFLLYLLSLLSLQACQNAAKEEIITAIGTEEYQRLMQLSLDDFDQSSIGFRQYADNYVLVSAIIPEYIRANALKESRSRNLHWHLGQIHAFHDNYDDAIKEMQMAYAGGSKTWECYVNGSIAFLEKDKAALEDALATLRQQENQMNIEFLEKFVRYFDKSYLEAYNADN